MMIIKHLRKYVCWKFHIFHFYLLEAQDLFSFFLCIYFVHKSDCTGPSSINFKFIWLNVSFRLLSDGCQVLLNQKRPLLQWVNGRRSFGHSLQRQIIQQNYLWRLKMLTSSWLWLSLQHYFVFRYNNWVFGIIMSCNYQTQEFNWSGVRSYVLIRVALLPKSTVSVIFCTQKLMYSKTCLMRPALGEKFCVGLHSTNKIKKRSAGNENECLINPWNRIIHRSQNRQVLLYIEFLVQLLDVE